MSMASPSSSSYSHVYISDYWCGLRHFVWVNVSSYFEDQTPGTGVPVRSSTTMLSGPYTASPALNAAETAEFVMKSLLDWKNLFMNTTPLALYASCSRHCAASIES